MTSLVLVRHGQSTWNQKNLFTGWTDVDLTERGEEEARTAGERLARAGHDFDLVFCSMLKRAIKTSWLLQERMDRMWLPITYSWELNERHYGALQGKDKKQTVAEFGADQVHVWRRSWDVPPPSVETDDERFPGHDPRYAGVDQALLPRTECLKDTYERVLPYWKAEVEPQLAAGKRVLIAAHGNSLRAIVKYLEDISDEDIAGMNIPTGIPRAYELDARLRPTKAEYLADPAELENLIQAVANQTKA